MRGNKALVFLLLTLLSSLSITGCSHSVQGSGGANGGGGGNGGGASPTPVFQISVSHSGSFREGQQNATYTINVTNVGNAATSGDVQVMETLTSGEALVSMSGSGWSFAGPFFSYIERSDALGPGQSWPPITVTVNVASSAASPQVNEVSGSGGQAETVNAQDSTAITHTTSFLFGRFAFLFSGFDASGAVSVAGSFNVDENGNLTGEEDFKDPTNLHQAQSASGFCQNYALPEATGFCKLTAAGSTYQYDFVLRSFTPAARFFENPIDNTGVSGSGILIAQQVPNPDALTSVGGFNGYFSLGLVGTNSTGGRFGIAGNIFTDLGGAITAGANGNASQIDMNDDGTLIQPASSSATNVTGTIMGPIDSNGRATAQLTAGSSPQRTLTLALYILSPQVPANDQSGHAFAIDITPIATNAQVLSGQFSWLGNPPPTFGAGSIFATSLFALWGVVPGPPAQASTTIGALSAIANQWFFDANTAGSVNGGGGAGSPLSGTINSINVAPNGRVQMSTTVNSVTLSYIIYLDAADDGTMLETGGDATVSFGFLVMGNAPSVLHIPPPFNNANITGTYAAATFLPILATAPNGAYPITLTPTGQVDSTFSGTFSTGGGSVTGTYSFDSAFDSLNSARGTMNVNSGLLFGNRNIVFYIANPNLIILMGADSGGPGGIAYMEF